MTINQQNDILRMAHQSTNEYTDSTQRKVLLMTRVVVVAILAVSLAPRSWAQTAPSTVEIPEGINDAFLSDELDPEAWLERWEVESREIYAARQDLVSAVGLRRGTRIADIGCGTGLFVPLFADRVTPEGKVYAVDISPKFIEFVRKRSTQANLPQVEAILGEANDVKLPNHSIDVAFLCDTYHHFEFPTETLQSIRFALRPGGELVVVDFERIPGVSRPWVLDHVRAGKDDFRAEIEQVGFVFEEEVKLDKFQENYMLRFRRP